MEHKLKNSNWWEADLLFTQRDRGVELRTIENKSR